MSGLSVHEGTVEDLIITEDHVTKETMVTGIKTGIYMYCTYVTIVG